MTTRQNLISIGLAGGIAGLANAALCFLRWPVPVHDPAAVFRWHVMPAGFVHGAVLALAAAAAALGARRWRRPARWGASILVGWMAGYLAWIPLDVSVFGERWARTFVWPFVNGDSARQGLWTPFCFFGLVSALLFLWLACPQRPLRPLSNILAAVLAGVLGSVWWWIMWKTWHFSILHGTVWGLSVGSVLARSSDR
jgi:hypothetical protein